MVKMSKYVQVNSRLKCLCDTEDGASSCRRDETLFRRCRTPLTEINN